MQALDFISEYPNLYILKKKSFKTNFGGILFLIYLIIITLVCIYKILDFTQNNKYTVEYFYNFYILTNKEEEEQRRNTDLYNPTKYFRLKIYIPSQWRDYEDRFKITDFNRGGFINNNVRFQEKIDKFEIGVGYFCEYRNCSDFYNLTNSMKFEGFYLTFEYEGFFLDHQNENKPIIKNENEYFAEYFDLSLNRTIITNQWKNIIYTEKKGLFFTEDIQDSCGYIDGYKSHIRDDNVKAGGYYEFFGMYFENDITQYIEYTRKRVSILDLLSSILSLISNFYFGIRIFYKFYSKNFYNFKIIERLCNKEPKYNYTNLKSFKSDRDNSRHDTKENIEEIKSNKSISIINDSNKDNNYLLEKKSAESEENDNNDNDNDNESNIKIKKFHFFDFFLNNFYCCLKKCKSQKIIHLYNKIVYNYASIDSIIKNQILFENLFKDYKWNDPSLNNIENNDILIQLKSLVNN